MNGSQNRDGELLLHLSGAELRSGSFPHSGLAWRPHKSIKNVKKHTTVLVTKVTCWLKNHKGCATGAPTPQNHKQIQFRGEQIKRVGNRSTICGMEIHKLGQIHNLGHKRGPHGSPRAHIKSGRRDGLKSDF